MHYYLDGKRIIKAANLDVWLANIDMTQVGLYNSGVSLVSTIFTGIDTNQSVLKPENPMLFETLIIGGPRDGERTLSDTWENAEITHKKVCLSLNPDAIIE
jgi:hypothetical protein